MAPMSHGRATAPVSNAAMTHDSFSRPYTGSWTTSNKRKDDAAECSTTSSGGTSEPGTEREEFLFPLERPATVSTVIPAVVVPSVLPVPLLIAAEEPLAVGLLELIRVNHPAIAPVVSVTVPIEM